MFKKTQCEWPEWPFNEPESIGIENLSQDETEALVREESNEPPL